jgi:phosphonate transport system permease protein
VTRTWRRPPLIANPWLRWAVVLGGIVYLALALASVPVNWTRLAEGWSRGWLFVQGFLLPDFVSRHEEILEGLLESVVMTVVATVLGIGLSIPVALAAARNIAPRPVYLLARGFIAISRSFQEIIIAILFVAMFGFGPLAGMLTIAFATIGFMAKLLAEDIEDIEPAQAEAVRATGASWLQLMAWGIQPQVLPRLVGLSLYRVDINFRESAVVGIVGAGGIGATLNTAFGRYEYSVAGAILLIIIAIVMACEYSSSLIRRRFQ